MSDIDPSERSLGAEALSGTTAKVTALVVGFLGSVLFARVLGAGGFGAFYLLVTVENLVDRPISGVAQAARKRLSEDRSDEQAIFGAFLLLFGSFVLVVLVLSVVFGGLVDAYVGLDGAWLLFVLLFLALAAQDTFNTLLSATGQVGLTGWIDTLRSFLTIPTQIALVLLGYGVLGMTVGLAGASFVTVTIVVGYLGLSPSRPGPETFRSLWRYARFSIPSVFTKYGYEKAGFLLIGLVLSNEVAGQFEAAQKLTIPAVMLGGIASGVLMPQLSNLSSADEVVSGKINEVLSYSSLLAVPIAFGALAFPRKIIITVFGSEFASAGPLLVGYALYRLVRSRTMPLRSTFQGLDRPETVLYLTLAASTVLLGTGLPLLFAYGPVGMIAGMFLAELVWFVAAMVLLRRRYGVAWLPEPLAYQVAAGAVMFAVVEGLERVLGLHPWYWVFVVIGAGGVAYFAVLFGISREIRRTVWFVVRDFLDEKVPVPVDVTRWE